MTRFCRLSVFTACSLAVAGSLWLSEGSQVQAQTGKSKAKTKPITSTELKKLDAKLEEVQGTFLKDTVSIIKGYEDGGQFERAKILLEVLLKLDPKNEQIKQKLKNLDDQLLDSTEFDLELDPAKGWQPVGTVIKERLMRIEVDGDYKIVANLSVGPDGVPIKDPINDMVGGAPLGSVVAMIVPPPTAPNDRGGEKKQPNAFHVGSKYEQGAQRDGMLLIKVNVPPGAKCTGKLKVKVGGVNKST
ncbi:MAG: hypothetical protein JSS49_21850 [Planctomycetes bacterium]|nr:hypothetical protein [Planctomycetota bacterium]